MKPLSVLKDTTILFLLVLYCLPTSQAQYRTESVEGYKEWQDDSHFMGVWLKKANRQLVKNDLNLTELKEMQRRYAHNGRNYGHILTDVEYDLNSGFTATFDLGRSAQELVHTRTWEQFAAKWRSLSQRGYRLTEFEPYRAGAKYFIGVFTKGSGGYYLWRHSSWSSMMKKANENHKKGLRLVDFEIDVENNGVRYYTGVWRSGSYGNYIYKLRGWNAFIAKWKEMGKKNYRLVDVERFKEGSSEIYVGVWRSGKENYYLWKVQSWAQFSKKKEELLRKGYTLVDLETHR